MVAINNTPREITGLSSLILDALRILAAFFVLVSHIYIHWFPSTPAGLFLDNAAHCGVIIFFVLSGYVIGYTTIRKNRGGIQYLSARFSRLYSVLFPALLITFLIQSAIYFLNTNLYEEFSRGPAWIRFVVSGLFFNEIWFFSSAPPINGPLWSLSYEFWYYMIFGVFFYKGHGWKWFLPGFLVCIIAGPKILLLMPIWLFGYLAYRFHVHIKYRGLSWALVFICFSTALWLFCNVPPFPWKKGLPPFFYSNQFVTDYFLGISIASALWLMPVGRRLNSTRAIMIFRQVADLTYPIYVLHAPFMILYDALTNYKITHIAQLLVPLIAILSVCVLIGVYLERYRYLWVQFFNWAIRLIFEIVKWNFRTLNLSRPKAK